MFGTRPLPLYFKIACTLASIISIVIMLDYAFPMEFERYAPHFLKMQAFRIAYSLLFYTVMFVLVARLVKFRKTNKHIADGWIIYLLLFHFIIVPYYVWKKDDELINQHLKL